MSKNFKPTTLLMLISLALAVNVATAAVTIVGSVPPVTAQVQRAQRDVAADATVIEFYNTNLDHYFITADAVGRSH